MLSNFLHREKTRKIEMRLGDGQGAVACYAANNIGFPCPYSTKRTPDSTDMAENPGIL